MRGGTMILSNGTLLGGRYRILEQIGMGGMATVYRANDEKLERSVTVKVLKEEFTEDEDFRSRFKTEARAAAKLSHPNIVNVYDVGEGNGIYYIVMEYVHGETLKKVIQKSAPLDNVTTLSIAIQMASALEHAHQHGVVHRDIKPQNILISMDGTIKITDFGIARAAADATTTDTALGSVYYFSPEQARGGYVDDKSDIYSLGITMFEMLTGHVPFEGDNSVSIALKHLNSSLPDLRQYNPAVSDTLMNIIKKATQKKKDDRYASITQMLSDLRQALYEERHSYGDSAQKAASPLAEEPRPVLLMEEESHRQPAQPMDDQQEEPFGQEEEVQVELGSRKENTLPEGGVSFERYSKQLKISKDNDDYEEDEYEQRPPRRAPKKKPQPKRPPKGRKAPQDSEEEAYYKAQEKKVTIAAVITALVIIAVITVVGARFLTGQGLLGNSSTQDETSTVPSFLGMTLEEAQQQAQTLGITINQTGEEYSGQYDEEQIMEQSVQEGSAITEGMRVDVTVSLGMRSFPMPDVIYDDEDVALEKIQNAGGSTPQREYVFDDVVPQGVVIDQDPEAQTQADSSTPITLTISKGPETATVTVPSFLGMIMGEAQNLVAESGLQVGTVTVDNSASGERDEIISQSIDPNEEVERDTRIDFVVVGQSIVEPEESEETTPEQTQPAEETPAQEDGTEGSTQGESILGGDDENGTISEPQTPAVTSGSQTFTVGTPSSYIDANSINVKILRIDSASSTVDVAFNENRPLSDFPFNVTVSGSGQMEVQLYIDNVYQWSQMVDFSGGTQ
ncbi:MAG TPA: protein kinase [Firmicutes bacterium]|nr:protein kinase [Bacillota bacterium]